MKFSNNLATIDFFRAFDSVRHLILFHKLISAGLFPLFGGLNFSFVTGALASDVKIAKVTLFQLAQVVRKDLFLGPLCSFLFMIALLLFFPRLGALFVQKTRPSSSSRLQLLLRRPHKKLWFYWKVGVSTGVFLSIRANVVPPFRWISTRKILNPDSLFRFHPIFLGVIFGCSLF